MGGYGEIGIHQDAALPVGGGPRSRRQFPAELRDRHASGPQDGPAFIAMNRVVRGFENHAAIVHPNHFHSAANPHAEPEQGLFRARGQGFRVRRQHSGGAIQDDDARILGANGPEVAFEGVQRDFAQRAGEFHAGGPRADDYERQPGAALALVGGPLGGFERIEDLAADGRRLFHGFQARSACAPFLVAVVGAFGACGDDQGIVGESGAVAQNHELGGGIDVDRLPEQYPDVAPPAQDAPQRGRDLRR